MHHASYVAEILEFAVGAAYRGHGIGRRMLEGACQLAKERNCVQIEVASSQFRKNAHRFYLREGMINSHFKFSKEFR